jgi:hypothetical protein
MSPAIRAIPRIATGGRTFMQGRTYYITTLAAWRHYAARFATSHYAHANPANESAAAAGRESPSESNAANIAAQLEPGAKIAAPIALAEPNAKILALVEADEGVHNALAADPEWEALPHPLTNKPVSVAAAAALAAHGVTPGATTFDVAEAVSRAHPILAYRVF